MDLDPTALRSGKTSQFINYKDRFSKIVICYQTFSSSKPDSSNIKPLNVADFLRTTNFLKTPTQKIKNFLKIIGSPNIR